MNFISTFQNFLVCTRCDHFSRWNWTLLFTQKSHVVEPAVSRPTTWATQKQPAKTKSLADIQREEERRTSQQQNFAYVSNQDTVSFTSECRSRALIKAIYYLSVYYWGSVLRFCDGFPLMAANLA